MGPGCLFKGQPGLEPYQQLLGNTVLLTHEGYCHLSFQDPSACVDEATAADPSELIMPARGTVCQSNQLPFAPGFD